MVYIQHGYGVRVTATDTPQRIEFNEEGENRRARSVSVKNAGETAVLLLVNVSTNNTTMGEQFDAMSPVILDGGDAFVFVPEPLSGPAIKNVACKTASGTTEVIVAAF